MQAVADPSSGTTDEIEIAKEQIGEERGSKRERSEFLGNKPSGKVQKIGRRGPTRSDKNEREDLIKKIIKACSKCCPGTEEFAKDVSQKDYDILMADHIYSVHKEESLMRRYFEKRKQILNSVELPPNKSEMYSCPEEHCTFQKHDWSNHQKMRFHLYYHKQLKFKGMNYYCDETKTVSYPCPHGECGLTFDSYNAYKTHENKFHNEFYFRCRDPSCDYGGTRDNRINHWRLVHSISSFKCEKCGKEYKWADQYRNHVKSHDSSNWVTCNICSKMFPHSFALEGHKSRIHVEPENYRYKCEICDEKFRRRENVEAHLVHDHGHDRKYNCEYCPAKFIQKIHLSRHLRMFHTNTDNPRTPSIRMRSKNTKSVAFAQRPEQPTTVIEEVAPEPLMASVNHHENQSRALKITTQITTHQTCVLSPEQYNSLQNAYIGCQLPKVQNIDQPQSVGAILHPINHEIPRVLGHSVIEITGNNQTVSNIPIFTPISGNDFQSLSISNLNIVNLPSHVTNNESSY